MKQMYDATEDIEVIKNHFQRAWDKAWKLSGTWTNQKQRILFGDLMAICEKGQGRIQEYKNED